MRFESSPGHSVFILFYNQEVTTLQPENQTFRPVAHGSRAVYVSGRKTVANIGRSN
jgi:hypothetical protein